ncbi:hypothetical protein P8452_51036 [Trifolium repens]|nr:hypothetical protein P8452_51036 [Trifolium repens]
MSHEERGITQQKERVMRENGNLNKNVYKKLMETEMEHSMCEQHNRREGNFIDLRNNFFEGVDDSSNVIVNHGASMIMNWTLAQEMDVLQQVAGDADSLSS